MRRPSLSTMPVTRLGRQTNWTALHRAAERGRTEVVMALLAAGADHTLATSLGGDTALNLASERGHTSTVQHLLSNGASAMSHNKIAHTPVLSARFGSRLGLLDGGTSDSVVRDLLRGGASGTGSSGSVGELLRSTSYRSPRVSTEHSGSLRAPPGRTYSGIAALAAPSRNIGAAAAAGAAKL